MQFAKMIYVYTYWTMTMIWLEFYKAWLVQIKIIIVNPV